MFIILKVFFVGKGFIPWNFRAGMPVDKLESSLYEKYFMEMLWREDANGEIKISVNETLLFGSRNILWMLLKMWWAKWAHMFLESNATHLKSFQEKCNFIVDKTTLFKTGN